MKIGAQIEIGTISTMADGGNKLVIYTPELSVADRTTLFEFAKVKSAYMVLAEAPVESIDVPEVSTDTSFGKTPSERLRGTLYRWWEKEGKPMTGFPVFYETEMEKLIDQVKAKLN